MKKRQWRQKVKSFFERHIDPEKEDKLEETRKGVEHKRNIIIDLIMDQDEGDKRELLLELIDDFHKQYESLYTVYGHLAGELKKKAHGEKEEGISSSDSESDSSMDENGNLENDFHKLATGLQKELEVANVEVLELVKKLEVVNHEKESLRFELAAALSKLHAAKTVIEDSKVEAEWLNHEKLAVLAEKEVLSRELAYFHELEVELSNRINELTRERDSLKFVQENTMKMVEEGEKSLEELKFISKELKNEKQHLKLKLVAAEREISGLMQQLDMDKQEAVCLDESMRAIKDENRSLARKVSEGEVESKRVQELFDQLTAESAILKEKLAYNERENIALQEVHERHAAEAAALRKTLEDERNAIKLELVSLQGQKRDAEVQLESKRAEASVLSEEVTNLHAQIVQLEMMVNEKEDQLNALTKKLEDSEKDFLSKMGSLTAQLASKIQEAEALHAQKSEMEELIEQQSDEKEGMVLGLEAIKQEASDLKQQLEKEVAHLNESLNVAEEEKNFLAVKVTAMDKEIKQGQGIIKELRAECSQWKEKMTEGEIEQSLMQESYEAQISDATARMKLLEEQVEAVKLELENEKESHKLKLLTTKQEMSGLKELIELAKQEVIDLTETKTIIEEEKGSLVVKVSDMDDEIKHARMLVDELTVQTTSLKEKLDLQEKEHISAQEIHETQRTQTSAQMKALEDEINNFKIELGLLQLQKREIELLLESKAEEADQFSKESTNLRGEIALLEITVKEKEDLMTALKKLEDSENESVSRIQSLAAQVASLVQEVEAVRARRNELEEKISRQSEEKEGVEFQLESVKKEASHLKQQLHLAIQEVIDLKESNTSIEEERRSLVVKVSDMNDEIKRAGILIDEVIVQSTSLKEKLDQQKKEHVSAWEIHETYRAQASAQIKALEDDINNLKNELGSLQGQKREIELLLANKAEEAEQFSKEATNLQADIAQLELTVKEKEDQLTAFSKKLEDSKNESVSRIQSLTTQVASLVQEVEAVRAWKSELEEQLSQQIEEKEGLEFQLESVKKETSDLKQQLDLAKQELADYIDSFKITEQEKEAFAMKVAELANEIKQGVDIAEQLTAESSQLKEKLTEVEQERSSLQVKHEAYVGKATTRVKIFEEQSTGLKLELESLNIKKREVEGLLESKDLEANHLVEEAGKLHSHISQLEANLKQKEDQIAVLVKMLEDEEFESEVRVDTLTEQISNLTQDMDALRSLKCELEEQIMRERDEASAQLEKWLRHIKQLQEESKAIEEKNVAWQVELEKKALKTVEHLVQLETLNAKVISSSADQERTIKEKEDLALKVRDLELKVESLKIKKSGLEEQIGKSADEAYQSRLEIAQLESSILELEILVAEKKEESFALHRQLEEGENEASPVITTLKSEISNIREECKAMQVVGSQLETEIGKKNQEHSENLNQLEIENSELRRTVTEQDAAFHKLNEEHNQLEVWLQETDVNLQATERVTKEMAEELSKSSERNSQTVAELERTIADLKFSIEMAIEERNAAVEKSYADELQLALSNQKLRVTEQLLFEREEGHRTAQAKFEEERKMLEEKVTSMSGDIADINEVYCGMIKVVSQKINDAVAELRSVIEKFEEKFKVFSSSIVKVSAEIQATKKWVSMKTSENEQLKQEVNHIAEQLCCRREGQQKQESLLIEARREIGDNEALHLEIIQQKKAVQKLEAITREKDELLSRLGEEKREAIRQLCLWIGYHMDRYNEVKELLKMNARRQ